MKHSKTTCRESTPWFLYLLECRRSDGRVSFYVGITTDTARRFSEHLAGKGAHYTRANKPIRMLATRLYADRSEASRAEAVLKKLPRMHKLAFMAQPWL